MKQTATTQQQAQMSAGVGRLVSDPDGVRYETRPVEPIAAATSVTTPVAIGLAGRIVVGVDGSAASVDALRHGIRIARALGASVEAVTSWQYGGYASVLGEFMDVPEEDARAILAESTTAVFGAKVPDWFTTAAFHGDAQRVLIEQSKGAEMLIVGSRGLGGLAGMLLGSVSAICAERASCPVLIVH
jgi:nucleotide-binding universal stress UspA family protein